MFNRLIGLSLVFNQWNDDILGEHFDSNMEHVFSTLDHDGNGYLDENDFDLNARQDEDDDENE